MVATLAVVATIGSVVASLAVVVALYYASHQVVEAKKMRTLDSVLTLHNEFMAPEYGGLRRVLADRDNPPDPSVLWASPDGVKLQDMINEMELLGALVAMNLVELRVVQAVFPFFDRTWASVAPIVNYRRSLGDEYSGYGSNAESLAGRYVR